MKKILLVFVLLMAVPLVLPVGQVGSAWADGGSVLQVPRRETHPADMTGVFYGPAGDPDGMGTGNGVVEPGVELVPITGFQAVPQAAPDPTAEASLRLVLTLIQVLVI